jgi:hypothetical protein
LAPRRSSNGAPSSSSILLKATALTAFETFSGLKSLFLFWAEI